ncbi:MAG: hypothetical protein LBC93_04505 [Synergistaceae bacterium]|jgi:hypothetical protein|nr:hypothetical protein [Synergistaceae bacterium]
MTSKNPVRSCEDVDESVLSYAEVKALASGDPRIREKMELDVEVVKLKMAKSEYQNNVYSLQYQLRKHFPAAILREEESIAALRQDEELAMRSKESEGKKFPGMTLLGRTHEDKKEAGEALLQLCGVAGAKPLFLGEYRGFDVSVRYKESTQAPEITLKGRAEHLIELGKSGEGNIVRLNNALEGIGKRLADREERLEDLLRQVQAAREEITKPFSREKELAEKSGRLDMLNIELDLDKGGGETEVNESVAEIDLSKEKEEEALVINKQAAEDAAIAIAKQEMGFGSFIINAEGVTPGTYNGKIVALVKSDSDIVFAQQFAGNKKQGALYHITPQNIPSGLNIALGANLCVTKSHDGNVTVKTWEEQERSDRGYER